MNFTLENFAPRLRRGRVIPQGSRIVFETEDPYNQIVLPMALADLVLLCSGQYTVRQIIDKIYKKQGAVPFKSILTALHLLHQGGFFENGEELELSSHLQSWMKSRRRGLHLGWTFGPRIVASSSAPMVFYTLTLALMTGSIFGLQHIPEHPLTLGANFLQARGWVGGLLGLLLASSALQTLRYLMCGVQLVLLTSKAYNVALRLSVWGVHLHVGDEANDLFENRLYTSMFLLSQILAPWWIVLLAAQIFEASVLDPLIIAATLITLWELNPFVASEGRKLMRALLIPDDRDVASWHFEGNQLLNSINPEARRRDQDFAKLCAIWGVFYLVAGVYILQRSATTFAPQIASHLKENLFNPAPWLAIAAWFTALYFVAQTLVEILGRLLRPYFNYALARAQTLRRRPERVWAVSDVSKQIEQLPLFSHFHEEFLVKITERSQTIRFPEGSVIVSHGEAAHDLFVLLDGEVEVTRPRDPADQDLIFKLRAVSVFGENALVDQSPRAATVTACTAVTVLKVPTRVIREVALESESVRQLEVFRNAILVNQFFASSPVFRSLSFTSIEYLSSRGTLEHFTNQQVVFAQGDPGDSFYLVLRGSVSVEIHHAQIKQLNQGSFFGEIALIANIPRTATIRCLDSVVCFKISADAFWDVLVQHVDLGVFIETVSESRLKEDLEILPPLKAVS